MHWFPTATLFRAGVLIAFLLGCDAQPQPEQAEKPLQQPVEQPVLDPVHLGEDRLRTPLLETLRQQIEKTETQETREVTEPLMQQLASADVILSEARQKNRAAIQQANRQVRMGAARQSPNLLLITVDRLGVGDLGCYGQTRWETPALDKLAADGLRFTQCYSGLNPAASRSALLTAHFALANPSGRATGVLPKILWNAGYKTALIGEWSEDSSPTNQGYEESSGWNVASSEFPDWALLNGKRITLENNANGQRQVSQTDFLISEVRSFLRDARSRSNQFFLHVSIRAFEDLASRSLNAEDYATRMRHVDATSGRIVGALDEFGLSNRTCLFFTATSGPDPALSSLIQETRSAGSYSHSDQGWREGNLRVPFLVRWPGQVPAGTVSEEMVGLWDILPTLAKLALVSRPLGQVDGRSLVEVLKHNQPLKERRVIWRSDDGSVLAVREKNWKAVRGEPKRVQLFDLSSDLAEENDVSAKHDAVLQRLIQAN